MCDLSGILMLLFLNFNGSVENYVGKDGVFVVCLVSSRGFFVIVKFFPGLYPA